MATRPTIQHRLEAAMNACGLPLSLYPGAFEYLGAGSQHDAYLVRVTPRARPLVVRLRRPSADGPATHDQARVWHAEYAGTSLYYRRANRAASGTCPDHYHYHVADGEACTIEQYMGTPLDLPALRPALAYSLGAQLGHTARALAGFPVPVPGYGELVWNNHTLRGATVSTPVERAAEFRRRVRMNAQRVLTSRAGFARGQVQRALEAALALRGHSDEVEPPTLVNAHVTPDRLTVQDGGRVGLVGPNALVGNTVRFAAWFVHTYRFLLPAYADAPRLARWRFAQHAPVLHAIADGFEAAYTAAFTSLRSHMAAEAWLWTLEEAAVCVGLLEDNSALPSTLLPRVGTREAVSARLAACVAALELGWV